MCTVSVDFSGILPYSEDAKLDTDFPVPQGIL